MVAGVLAAAGVYLGVETDFLEAREGENADGFREHFGFNALNERLLEHLGAGWDPPRMAENWEARGDLEPFREEAVLLADRMGRSAGPGGHWGWKDPRSSITIPFWRSLLPDAKVVVCVRDPADVAASQRKRNNLSRAAAGRLWLAYYGSLLAHVPEFRRVVTHYEAYFENFDRAVERLCAGLGIPLDETKCARARACVKPALRHNREAGLSAGA